MEDELPLLDLFEAMRSAFHPIGIALVMEQYEALCRAIDHGYGLPEWDGTRLESWEPLRRLCRLLWVKPIPSYAVALKIFDRTFDDFRAGYQDVITASLPELLPEPEETPASTKELQWPTIPPRKGYESKPTPKGEIKTVGGFQASPKPPIAPSSNYHLMPQDFPLSLETIARSWRSLRQAVREGGQVELDIDATVARIVREGVLDDVVMRPVLRQRAELLVLIDDSPAMVPFRWAIAPLIQAITDGWVSPGQLYRFTTYPEHYLYDWLRSAEATAISAVLSRLHRSRTVLMMVSDAGAATGIVRAERIQGTVKFVERALPCVRQLIWVNPLPEERWKGTSAQAIATALHGRMIALDAVNETVMKSQSLGGVLV